MLRARALSLCARQGRALSLWVGCFSVLLLSGCATYVDHLRKVNLAAGAGDYGAAIGELNDFLGSRSAEDLPSNWSGDRPLATLERATLQQARQEFAGSARDFSAAEQQLELLDLSSDPIGTLASYLYSDSAKTYRIPPTERLALNAINLLNYLARSDLDGAAVEARRFQVMREYLETLHIQPQAPTVLGAYLAGFVFERRGEGDRALRYYEEAMAAGPLASLDSPVRHLAGANPYRGENINKLLTKAVSPRSAPARSELLIVMGLGRVPHKEPQRIPVGAAVGLAGVYATREWDVLKYGATKVVVYPELVSTPSNISDASLRVDGESVAWEELSNLTAAIRHEYEELKPQILAAALSRMATRAALTEGVRAGARKEDEALATILSLLFESALVALDRPDTRSWNTLPERYLVARLPVAAGSHMVEVDLGPAGQRQIQTTVADGSYGVVVITEPR